MSLFGTSPDAAPARPAAGTPSKSSLFDDEPKARNRQSGGGLFADTDDTTAEWGFQPTPKKQARGNLVRNLLASTDVPESYIDVFDALMDGGDRAGAGVSLDGVLRLLRGTGLGAAEQDNVLKLVTPEGAVEGLGRAEFNVLLALIGLAQEGEEASLDGVDERRRRLPQPSLPEIRPAKPSTPPRSAAIGNSTGTPTKSSPRDTTSAAPHSQSRAESKQTFAYSDPDPWGSPVNTKSSVPASSYTNGVASAIQNAALGRTTSSFTTGGQDASTASLSGTTQSGGGSDTWGGGFDGSGAGFGEGGIEGGGFGGPPGDDGSGQPPGRSKTTSRGSRASQSLEETITITALPDKEGSFLFQYRNYEVASQRRSSKVVRRYSDFVWLLDCLHKKYPFRQLPLLPPKRVATTDDSFIEKRRRGLARFANALVRHPILGQEQLVIMFLTVPTELSVWRKQATITVQEEFTGKPLPAGLEESLPATLEALFDSVRAGIKRSSEVYIALCAQLERIVKRKEGLASEYSRFSATLASVTESSDSTYKFDTNDVPMLNEGIAITSKHIGTGQSLLVDEARAWDEGVLEDFKAHRDALVAMRDMFDRKDRLARDNIPQLEKRIAGNESKLAAVRSKPDGSRKPGEAEKLEDAIMKDKESIVNQHARGVFIKECVRDEIQNFQTSQYHVSRTCQEWSHDRVKYAELQADNWRSLAEQVEGMPLGES